MTRIYVTNPETAENDGWFDEAKATYWKADTYWDGEQRVDVNTRTRNSGQGLYRTAQGRWVLRHFSSWVDEQDRYHYTDTDEARDWLTRNGEDEAVKEHFGRVEEERGPGRPEIGGAVLLRLGDVLPKLDAWAAEQGVSRAEAVRRLVSAALASSDS